MRFPGSSSGERFFSFGPHSERKRRIVKFSEATAQDKIAYCHLKDGSVLRYEPGDRPIRRLGHPATVGDWKQAPALQSGVPADGWTHLPGCACPSCTASATREG
jgi:hypothetical protein